jgi:outer membrane murein-binding lipoprotein Lpp
MKRFLMLVAVAAVAGAMYVAASPASQQSSGPTAKQFKALKAQVAALSKKLKTTENNLDSLAVAYVHCSLPSEIGVAQFTVGVAPQHTTALDLAASGQTYELTPYDFTDSGCQSLIGAAAGAKRPLTAAGLTRKFAQKP